MNVTVLRSTEQPERLVCQAARGDYYDGYVGDTEYAELMESVEYDESHRTTAVENLWPDTEDPESADRDSQIIETEARTVAFCEKQLSRGHYGPWEHPQITFAVEGVSRVTMAQITRHRHMTFDVQSQRYVDFSNKNAIVPRSLEAVSSEDTSHFSRDDGLVEELDGMNEDWALDKYREMTRDALDFYNRLVDSGVPKEDARFILPLGTPVNMTFSGNARTFMHVFNLRQKASSQWEIRELCNALADELQSWMPYSFGWYERNKPHKIGP